MKIKDIRLKAYLTQAEFAKQIGVCRDSIIKWEAGNNMSIKNKRKVLEFCKKNGIEV